MSGVRIGEKSAHRKIKEETKVQGSRVQQVQQVRKGQGILEKI
jgi:hypothetical protein